MNSGYRALLAGRGDKNKLDNLPLR